MLCVQSDVNFVGSILCVTDDVSCASDESFTMADVAESASFSPCCGKVRRTNRGFRRLLLMFITDLRNVITEHNTFVI